MSRPPLFLDLDGPLLDVRARYHGVYARIAVELGVEPMARDDYWQAKRQRRALESFFPGMLPDRHDPTAPRGADAQRSWEAMPGLRQWLREAYLQRWLAWIESPEWLDRDELVAGARECLESLRDRYSLYLVTLRRNGDGLRTQLDTFDLRQYFDDVFSGWSEKDGAGLKAAWMQPLAVRGRTALVGDSEVDMEAARQLGLRGIGVSFGIREADELRRLGAECVVDHLGQLPEMLGCRSCGIK